MGSQIAGYLPSLVILKERPNTYVSFGYPWWKKVIDVKFETLFGI